MGDQIVHNVKPSSRIRGAGNKTGRAGCQQGARVGWVERRDLYLDPSVSYAIAQDLSCGTRIPISEQILRVRLRERGLLASVDQARQTLKVRRTIENAGCEVLHLRVEALLGRSG